MMQRRPLIALGASALALPTLMRPRVVHAATLVGQAAPDFTLPDTSGQSVTLSQFRGRPVVLEWNNPGCPFVRKHYQGNLQALQKTYTGRGVAWLVINSTADSSADYHTPPQLARWMQERGAAATATLMDEEGQVGRTYGARFTPHMYVIDAQGILVYAGGIDSVPSARVADIERATNYVSQALDEVLAGKPVSKPTSLPYGCTIKYKGAA